MSASLHAAIAEQAYYLWLEDGMAHGRSCEHWVTAEKMMAVRTFAAPIAPAKAAKKKAAPKTSTRAARIRATEAALHS